MFKNFWYRKRLPIGTIYAITNKMSNLFGSTFVIVKKTKHKISTYWLTPDQKAVIIDTEILLYALEQKLIEVVTKLPPEHLKQCIAEFNNCKNIERWEQQVK